MYLRFEYDGCVVCSIQNGSYLYIEIVRLNIVYC